MELTTPFLYNCNLNLFFPKIGLNIPNNNMWFPDGPVKLNKCHISVLNVHSMPTIFSNKYKFISTKLNLGSRVIGLGTELCSLDFIINGF